MSNHLNQQSRILFIKKQNRRKRQHTERLHGAFTGGFSAGHYNTVGSKNGWKPCDAADDDDDGIGDDGEVGIDSYGGYGRMISNNNNINNDDEGNNLLSSSKRKLKKKRIVQRVEDFMDEEDAEWGGPTQVKQVYQSDNYKTNDETNDDNNSNNIQSHLIKDSSSLRKLLYQKKSKNNIHGNSNELSIGKQLLKVLGWREERENSTGDTKKSYAYVSFDVDEKPQDDTLLSSKRLRRIELKLTSHNRDIIPIPKTDTYGMGYEPYSNAPEFKAHREMRKQKAQERAKAAASNIGQNRMNVYNMSAFDDNDYDDDVDGEVGSNNRIQQIGHKGRSNNHNGNDVLAYETVEDFIGNKTSAGFALHDDDDQVYDKFSGHSASLFNKGQKDRIDMSEYHNEVYDGSDSDVEDGPSFLNHVNSVDKTNKHQSKSSLDEKQKSTIQTFAGALGSWIADDNIMTKGNSHKDKAVTSDGEPPLKGFVLGGSNCETMDRFPGPDVPIDYVPKPHQFSHEDAISNMKELSTLMKQNMKSTYAIPSLQEQTREPIASKAFASLSTSLKNRFTASKLEQESKTAKEVREPREIKISRVTIAWQPSHLLLKRFNVETKTLKAQAFGSEKVENNTSSYQINKTREETFFEKDIMGKIDKFIDKKAASTSSQDENESSADIVPPVERPSLELMKSIFEPSSDDESNIDEQNADVLGDMNSIVKAPNIESSTNLTGIQVNETSNNPSKHYDSENASSDSSVSRKRKKRRKKSSSRDKKRKKYKNKRK